MQDQNRLIEWYRSKFDELERTLNGEAATPVHELRKRALAQFGSIGFPSTREEEWRFTNVAPIAKVSFSPAVRYPAGRITQDDVTPYLLDNSYRLAFVNGHWSEEFSRLPELPRGVRIESLRSVLRTSSAVAQEYLSRYVKPEQNGFTALSAAFLMDGAFIFIPDGTELPAPIHLLFLSTAVGGPIAAHPRTLIVTGKDCRVPLVESYVGIGEDNYLTNAVTEVVVGEGTTVEHDKLQLESLSAFHIGTTAIQQLAGSSVTSNSVALGGALVRNTVSVVLDGERCECTLNGLSLGTERQLIDNHTSIDHAHPHCESHELYKSVLDGAAKGVFNGKITVRRDAQKTDAKQTNKTLLLSDDATINTKPQLEIFADDVKCTHGATVGQLDEEQLFYLQTRGIGIEAARDLLTFAFATDVINRIHVEPLHAQLDTLLHNRLRQGRVARGR